MAEKCQKDEDINEIFTDILLGEEKLIANSYEEGFKQGASEGNLDGYHLGYHRGAEIGAELGYISTVIKHYYAQYSYTPELKRNTKVIELLNDLKVSIELFPKWNDPEFDLVQKIDNVRTKFKKLLALLKVNDCDFFKGDNLSF